MRICSGAGCLRVVAEDVRFCDECKPQPQSPSTPDGIRTHTNTDRERYAFLYSSPLWSRIRGRVVREQPMCATCGKRLTTIVDHIVPAGVAIAQAEEAGIVGVKYAGFYMRSNLQGLCRECHYIKTNEDKAHVGEWLNVCIRDSATAKRKWSF